jgi:glycerophosphoryl diester phosphodiesterase
VSTPEPPSTWSQARRRHDGNATPVLIAHRGASAHAPENTRPALQLAVEQGADGVEVDVQRTRDGVPVLVHDEDWRRTTGNPAAVRDLAWEHVCRLDAGGWFSPEHSGVRPGILEDALEIAQSHLVNLEIKSPHLDDGLAASVVALVRSLRLQGRVLLTSFDHACINTLADAYDDLELGYLATHRVETLPTNVRTLVVNVEALLSAPEIVRDAHAHDRGVLVYTVDDATIAERLGRLQVDGIITNNTPALRGATRGASHRA